jgi:hypothetical protein
MITFGLLQNIIQGAAIAFAALSKEISLLKPKKP